MALTQTQVSQLYVSIFNRASEGEGNKYWQQSADAKAAANNMLATPAAKAYFGTSLDSNEAFIKHIYLNTLNKTYAQDKAGVDYWVSLLNAGTSRGEVVASLVAAVADYASSTDPVTKAAYDQFNNRVDVSNYMANTVEKAPANYATSTKFATSGTTGLVVTNSASTVTDAKTSVDTMKPVPGQTFTLTNSTDTKTASIFNADQVYTPGGNDRINSLQDEDTLTGTGTNPTLNVTLGNQNDNGSKMITPTLNGIETINASMSNTDGTGLDLQDATGLKTVNVTRISTAGSDIQNMQATATDLSAANTSAIANVSFTYMNAELTGDQTVDLSLSNVNAANLIVGSETSMTQQIETLNLNAVTASSALALSTRADALATTNQTVNIVATQDFSLGNDIDGDSNVIEHNNALGAVTVGADGVFGTGDDVFTAATAGIKNINISGAGNVTLASVGSANDFALDGSTATGNIAVNITNAAAIAASTFTTGSGNDTIVTTTNLLGDVTTAAGDDTVTLNGVNLQIDTTTATPSFGSIATGEGNDTINVEGNIQGSVYGGASVDAGAGDDVMTFGIPNKTGVVALGEEATIVMGEGNDTLTMTATTAGDTGGALDADALGSSIDMGAGDDTVTVDLTNQNTVATLFGGTLAGGEGTNTLTITGNATVTAVAAANATNDDRVSGFTTLTMISEQSIDTGLDAAINAIRPGFVTANDVDAATADYTVDASEFTGLTSIVLENQAGIIDPTPEESVTPNRFVGDAATYTINNLEGQTISLTTVEAGTGIQARTVGTATDAQIAADTTADATLKVSLANVALGATESATSALNLTIAGAGDVTIDDTSVAGTGVLDDIEVLNLTVNGAGARTVALFAGDFETTATIAGDTTGTITFTNVEATTFTSTIAGNVNATMLTSENKTITTGAGNDVINLEADTVNKNDTINLGDGTDRIVIDASIRGVGADADETFDNMTSIEEVEAQGALLAAAINITLDDDAQRAGVNKVILTSNNEGVATSDANVDLDLGVDFENALTVDMAAESTLDLDNDANVNVTINMDTTDATSINTLTITDAGTGTVALNITVDDAAQAINATTAAANGVKITNANMALTLANIDTITLLDSNASTGIAPVVGGDQTGAITLTANNLWARAGETLIINASDINDDDRTNAGAVVNSDNQTVTIDASTDALIAYAVNVTGSQMVDTITGTAQNDTIDGQAGDDSITGGVGADTLTGGTGADTFILTGINDSRGVSGIDTITDFTTGTDKLQVALTVPAITAGDVVNLGRFATNTTIGNGLGELDGATVAGQKVYGDFGYASTDGVFFIDVDGDGNINNTTDYKVNVGTIAASDVNYVVNAAGAGSAVTIRGGQGADQITLEVGTNADTLVMVGSVTATQATAYRAAEIAAPGSVIPVGVGGVDDVLDISELTTVRTASEVNAGDKIVAGTEDTLHVYGTADLTLINNGGALTVGTLVVHSDVTLTAAQYSAIKNIVFDGDTPHTITVTLGGSVQTTAQIQSLSSQPTFSVTNSGANTTFTIGEDTATSLADIGTSGVSYILSDTAANLAAETTTTLKDAKTVTVTSATSAAADLNTIDAARTGTVVATAVTTITGTTADVKKAGASAGITTVANYAATITDAAATSILATDLSTIGGDTTGTVTVSNAINITGTTAEATAALVTGDTLVVASTATVVTSDAGAAAVVDAIAAKTSGIVTATVTSTDNLDAMNTAMANASATDAITYQTTDTEAHATSLTGLAGKTSVTLNAASVTTISSATVAQLLAIVNATDITTADNYAVTISDTTLDATNVQLINADNGTGTINIASATALTATTAEYLAIVENTGSVFTTKDNVAVTIEGADMTSANYTKVQGDTTGAITATVTQAGGVETLALTLNGGLLTDKINVIGATSASDAITVATTNTGVTAEVVGNVGTPAAFAIETVANGIVDANNNGTLTVADLTATTLTAVATSISNAFSFTDAGDKTAVTNMFAVESDTAGKWAMYTWTQSAIGDTSVDAAELTLVGTVTSTALVAADFGLV